MVSLFSIATFAVLFHPHVCLLFPEAQKMVGAKPWWENWADTSSAFFGLGVVLCTLWWVVFSDLFWEGRPWSLMNREGEGSLLKGIITFLATLAMGLITVYILAAIFNAIWMEPYVGGQYTDGPDWRFIHMGEVAGFCILFAFIWKHYFNNWPGGMSLWPRAIIRSIIGVAGGMLIYWFYYSPLTKFFLGKVHGWAQPDDKPLVWTLLFLAIVLIQAEFFHNWPLRSAGRDQTLSPVPWGAHPCLIRVADEAFSGTCCARGPRPCPPLTRAGKSSAANRRTTHSSALMSPPTP